MAPLDLAVQLFVPKISTLLRAEEREDENICKEKGLCGAFVKGGCRVINYYEMRVSIASRRKICA